MTWKFPWRHGIMRPARRSAFNRIVDSAMAFVLMVCVVVWADGTQPHIHDIAAFLQMRLTLTNACFALVFAVLWTECFKAADALIDNSRAFMRRAVVIASACVVMGSIVALYLSLRGSVAPRLQIVGMFMLVTLAYQLVRRPGDTAAQQNVIILGSGRRASMAWRELRTRWDGNINVLGFVDDRSVEHMPPDIAGRYLCATNRLSSYLLNNSVQ